jgi:isoleucyl-tRNA synthetase
MAEDGHKMSKSLGNQVEPQAVIKQSGADILRVWVASTDYADDQRIGPEILKTTVDTYRKLRNTLRWMLGTLTHFRESERVAYADMPELERYLLHRLWAVGRQVEEGYAEYDFKQVFAALMGLVTGDLSAFYFDIRKDALYCDPISSVRRRAALTVIDAVFDRLVRWLAPLTAFTAEEAWLHRHPSEDGSVHFEGFTAAPDEWRDEALAAKWEKIRRVRRVVTGALEIERAAKTIGASLEAAPAVYVSDPDLLAALDGVDLAEICITSAATVVAAEGPATAFRLDEVPGVAVEFRRAEGRKCARSWRILPEVGSDPDFPDLSLRDAQAMREWLATQAR